MPEIAKLDAMTEGYYAFATPWNGERFYQMDLNDGSKTEDMLATMQWIYDAGDVEEYAFEEHGDHLDFVVSCEALDKIGIDSANVADFDDDADNISEIVGGAFAAYGIRAAF